MSMSRKDYLTIAKVLHDRHAAASMDEYTVETIASELAAEFETDNRLFDREKFMNYVRTGSERGEKR